MLSCLHPTGMSVFELSSKGFLLSCITQPKPPDYFFLLRGITEGCLSGCRSMLFFDAADQIANIMASWFVLTHLSETSWPVSWSGCGSFSALSDSLDPWPATGVGLGAQGCHHHVEGRSEVRDPQEKVVQERGGRHTDSWMDGADNSHRFDCLSAAV